MSSTADPASLTTQFLWRSELAGRKYATIYWRIKDQDGHLFADGHARAALPSQAMSSAIAAARATLTGSEPLTSIPGPLSLTLTDYLNDRIGETVEIIVRPNGTTTWMIASDRWSTIATGERTYDDIIEAFADAVEWVRHHLEEELHVEHRRP